MPKLEESRVQHLQDPTDVTRAFAVEIKSSGGRIEISRLSAVAVALDEFHRHKSVEKIGDAARMQAEFLTYVRAGEPAFTEFREKIKRDCSEEDLGIPKPETSLQNCVW